MVLQAASVRRGGLDAGDRLRFVDLDGAATRHVQVRMRGGELERGVHALGLDDRVAGDLAGARLGAHGVTATPPASGVPKSIRPEPTSWAQAPMTSATCSGVGEVASASVCGAWEMKRGTAVRIGDSSSHAASATVVFIMVSNSTGVQGAQSGLPSAPVVGAFDPGHESDAQLLAGGPGATIVDVLLQQGEEALHGRVADRDLQVSTSVEN